MTTLPLSTDYAVSNQTAMKTVFSKFMEGVKNLVVKKHNLPITKIVDDLMEVTHTRTQYFNCPQILTEKISDKTGTI